MLPFAELAEFFTDESQYGQLCDIVVPDARRDAWCRMLQHVVPTYTHHFSLADKWTIARQDLPEDVASIVELAGSEEGPWPSLWLDLKGLVVNVHMFSPDWFEIDARRREITPDRYEALAALMGDMGNAMRHDVFMTPESSENEGALVYEWAKGAFRRPRHGQGADKSLKLQMFSAAVSALDAFASMTADSAVAAFNADPETVTASLDGVLESLQRIDEAVPELVKQDELTVEDRRALRAVWRELATMVRRPVGYAPEINEPHHWDDLIKAVRRVRAFVSL